MQNKSPQLTNVHVFALNLDFSHRFSEIKNHRNFLTFDGFVRAVLGLLTNDVNYAIKLFLHSVLLKISRCGNV